MAKKTKKPLLQEGTIRRMMKLANMEVLGDSFISSKYTPLTEETVGQEELEEKKRKKKYWGEKKGQKSDTGRGEDYINEQGEEMDLEGGVEDVEAAAIEEPGEDIEAVDVEEEAPEEIEAEVTVEDSDVDALRTARDVLDQVISAAGGEGEGEEEIEAGAEEIEDIPGEGVEEIGAEVEDLTAPGNRPDMNLYEAALSGLDIELVDDKAQQLKLKLEHVKQQVYKRVVERLLKESKK